MLGNFQSYFGNWGKYKYDKHLNQDQHASDQVPQLDQLILQFKNKFDQDLQMTKQQQQIIMQYFPYKKYLIPRNKCYILYIKILSKRYKILQRSKIKKYIKRWTKDQQKILVFMIIYYFLKSELDISNIYLPSWKLFSYFLNRSFEYCLHIWFKLISRYPINYQDLDQKQDSLLIKIVKQQKLIKPKGFWSIDINCSKKKGYRTLQVLKKWWYRKNNPLLKFWTPQEDLELFRYVKQYGPKWNKIQSLIKESEIMKRRTLNAVKNRYFILMKQAEPNHENLRYQNNTNRAKIEDKVTIRIQKYNKKIKSQNKEIQNNQNIKLENQIKIETDLEKQVNIQQSQDINQNIFHNNVDTDNIFYPNNYLSPYPSNNYLLQEDVESDQQNQLENQKKKQ